ncbi:chemotaxis protein CheW [Acidisphaera sp. L21]|uniref:chemotaxis protein CheW n=1 Tax=Acidisphaera sp. L21 TaxID=1641851 RepID=UPI00131EB1FE|nr:chemotaxis protein CheW [Acidisphaera sp. L21]
MNDALSQTKDSQTKDRELLSFRVGAQEFCVDIMIVREIRGWVQETPLPHAPSYVRGVVNLRGAVLSIIDLSERLGLGAADPTTQHVIIVAQIGAQTVGLLVSAVSDILTINDSMIQPTPAVAQGISSSYVQGLLTVENRMVSLLSTDKLVPTPELQAAA